MSTAVVLAGAAAACGVGAAWEALHAIDPDALGARGRRLVRPLVLAGRTGRTPTPPERLRLAVLGAASLFAAGWLVAGPLAGLLAAVLGPWLTAAVARARKNRWRARLADGAAAVARALADALGAGHSIRGAIGEAAHAARIPGPAGTELRSAAAALAVGERTEVVLQALARRAGDPAFDTIVAAILLQRDAGGDLSALLRSTAGALEASARARADARSATAQARFTAWLVAALPLLALGCAELASPGYLVELVGEPIPALLVGGALALEVLAIVLVRRVAVLPA